jgi:arylsulfatase
LREGKGTAWEGGTRVPCIMRWPGKLAAGRSSDAMLMTIDILPTIAKLIGAKLPGHKIDGFDVWPVIADRKGAKNPHEAYAFYYADNQLQSVGTGDGRWKLQFPHTYRTLAGRPGGKGGIPAQYELGKVEQSELHDLQSDIGEAKNVITEHPDVVKRLEAFAEKMRADLGDKLTKRKGSGVREPGRFTAP